MGNPGSYVMIDVRDDWEYDDNPMVDERISLYDLPKKLDVLEKFGNKKLVLCCRTGVRGNIGAKFLNKNGIKNVYNLEGGFEALMESEVARG